ncbi:MAG: VIT domain-containing protein [Planctomycetes bacterium]|nr:VIT domain-containing protein [Planctomycetota bacterium]
MRKYFIAFATILSMVCAAEKANAQRTEQDESQRGWAANVVVPQSRAFRFDSRAGVEITKVQAGVVIVEQVATTTMDIYLQNPSRTQQEAELLVPVPSGATVRGFDFEGVGAEPSARLLPAREASRTYESIVSRLRDPALLEFVSSDVVRTSVFPVTAGGTQKVRLTYEHLLTADAGRVDYVLPRTESVSYRVPWTIDVSIRTSRDLAAVYSPSHPIRVERGQGMVGVHLSGGETCEPGSYRLSYAFDNEGVGAMFFSYPDPEREGGYFLLVAGLLEAGADETAQKREVIVVLDVSGSMQGEKIEQARAAALQILEGLDQGESFNIVAYSSTVGCFAAGPVIKSRETMSAARSFLGGLRAGGGTDIHSALHEALNQTHTESHLPMVLFLTDGLPTSGNTSEIEIRNLATNSNPHKRRLFTFGVGVDVNTPLLERLADSSRGRATFVLPDEDVEVSVSRVFRGLYGPRLSDVVLQTKSPGRILDVSPKMLPDIFEGDQLTVFGRYVGTEAITFSIEGKQQGAARKFEIPVSLERSTTRNGFVPRLWASRRIGELIDEVRQMEPSITARETIQQPWRSAIPRNHVPDSRFFEPEIDPRTKELVDEIVSLSIEFGIMTEYTSFLSTEGTDLSNRDDILRQATANLESRGQQVRSGLGAVNQSLNGTEQRAQSYANSRNGFWNERMERVEITSVQQIADRAFYQRGGTWVDSRAIENENEVDRVVYRGTEEFRDLLESLARDGREGAVSLSGDVIIIVGGERIRITNPENRTQDE